MTLMPSPFTISNGSLTATISPLGAALRDLRMSGVAHPLVLGWRNPNDYLRNDEYFGGIVGRCANRIGNGAYTLSGKQYSLDKNFRGRHTLHGGTDGLDRQIWNIDRLSDSEAVLSLFLEDGHMGFGGALMIKACYRITDPSTLNLEIEARSSGSSLCNIAPHWYFNLDGQGDIKKHQLQIHANSYLPVDQDLIPTGSVQKVQDTPYDFRQLREVGEHPYDHNFCVSAERTPIKPVARLVSERSGLWLEISSTEPGLQVYSGSFLNRPDKQTLSGAVCTAFAGIALEPQCWPDAPNQPGFPNVVLKDGEHYRHHSEFTFGRLNEAAQ